MPENPPEFRRARRDAPVLVVDDSEETRSIIHRNLVLIGFRNIHTAVSGEEALSLCDEHKDEIALIVSDVQMPGINGDELFRQLKKKGSRARMILCSGSDADLDFDPDQLKEEGLRAFVRQPIVPESFMWAVAKAFS